MAEQEPLIVVEVSMTTSQFEKLEAVRANTSMGDEFYTNSLIKGGVINGLESQGLFVMAVDEERDTIEYLDNHLEAFLNAETPEEAVKSMQPRIVRFKPRQEE